MDQTRLALAGSFCWNPDCEDDAQVGHHNIRKFGQTARGVQRYQCKTCKKTCTETKGTVFHGCHHSPQTILDASLDAGRSHEQGLDSSHQRDQRRDGVCMAATSRPARLRDRSGVVSQLSRQACTTGRASRTYVGHKGEKGGTAKRWPEAPSGAARPLR